MYLSIYLPIYLSIYLPIYLSTYIYIYIYINLMVSSFLLFYVMPACVRPLSQPGSPLAPCWDHGTLPQWRSSPGSSCATDPPPTSRRVAGGELKPCLELSRCWVEHVLWHPTKCDWNMDGWRVEYVEYWTFTNSVGPLVYKVWPMMDIPIKNGDFP